MFSVPISMAVIAILTFLGVKLTAAQTAMVVGGVIIAVKIAIALGAVTLGTRVLRALTGKKDEAAPAPAAQAVEAPKPTE
jgi:phosphate/sulfate permease